MSNDLLQEYEATAMSVAQLVETLYEGIRDLPAPDSDEATTDDLQTMRHLERLLSSACRMVKEYA